MACASTGNTSASMAAYAARAGMRSLVLIPQGQITWGKLSQALDYGAVTCQLKTDFDGCMRVLDEVVQRMPVYLLNSVNPYRLEGQKTAAIELLERFDWQAPDHVIVPGGNLGNSSALGKAFLEMKELGSDFPPAEAFRDSGRRRQRSGANHAGDWRKKSDFGARGNHGDRHPHRQSGFMEESGARAGSDRRRGGAGERSRDRAGESRDWRGWHWLRAGIGRYSGGIEEAGRSRDSLRRTNRWC